MIQFQYQININNNPTIPGSSKSMNSQNTVSTHALQTVCSFIMNYRESNGLIRKSTPATICLILQRYSVYKC